MLARLLGRVKVRKREVFIHTTVMILSLFRNHVTSPADVFYVLTIGDKASLRWKLLCCDSCRFMYKLVETILPILRKSPNSRSACHLSLMTRENACGVHYIVNGMFDVELW